MSQLTRRSFLKVTAMAGSGLVLGTLLPAESCKAADATPGLEASIGSYVHIAPNGEVTITAPRPDCGQGVRTSLCMIIAEELGVDWTTVKVVQAVADNSTFGNQGVGGSGSVRGSFESLRLVGATAATMLKQAGAKKLGVDPGECSIENGMIVCGDKKTGIGEVAEAASRLPVPDPSMVKLKDPSQFAIIGKPTKRVDNAAVVTGKAGFGLDTRVPGMKFAVIARPATFSGQVSSVDDSEALKIPGVFKVFQMGSGVAVVADSTWAAIKGRDALKIEWNTGQSSSFDSAELTKRFQEAVPKFPELPPGTTVIEATYELPYLSHAPMEPMNCTAHVQDDKCEVWAPTQVPDGARAGVARQLSMPLENVTLHVTLVGGGFGRRLSTEYVTEAVAVSKLAGCPVQLLWTRDDDMQHDHYRPATYHALKGSVGSDGQPAAFYHACIMAGGGGRRGDSASWGRSSLVYDVPNAGVQFGNASSPVPTGAWRSVENTYMNLINECFFDELCAAAKKDPVELRMKLMKNDRLKATLAKAAELADWGKSMPKGHGRGVACFSGYGSYITQIAEVEALADGKFKVLRVVAVLDCGLAVNPLGVEAQIQGATMDGIATLLHSAITIKDGGAEQRSWAEFGWARHSDAPHIEVHLISGSNQPGGIGEVGFPASGPAVLNAIFAATGKRLRSLPIMKDS